MNSNEINNVDEIIRSVIKYQKYERIESKDSYVVNICVHIYECVCVCVCVCASSYDAPA